MSRRVAVVAIDLPDDPELDSLSVVSSYLSESVFLDPTPENWSLLEVTPTDEPWTRIEEGD